MEADLRILHLTAPARAGGLEKVVEALAVGHARRGHEVHVAATVDTAGDAEGFFEDLERGGVRTHAIVAPGRSYRRERESVRTLCRQIRPGVAHTHGYRPDVVTAGVARSLGIPVVTTVHGFTGGDWRNRIYEALQVRAFRRFDAVVAVSRPLRELLAGRGVPAGSLRLIVNAWGSGTDGLPRAQARAELGLPADGFCVGFLGRLTREKGADVLLEAVPALDADITVSFIGDGRERGPLEEWASALGIAPRVRWHGLIPHAGRLLSAFDAFALTSRTEGTPIALFEAMVAGTPIVASRVGGIPDVIGTESGILVSPERPGEVAAAILDIRRQPAAARTRVAQATRDLQTRFALEPWLAEYERLYREVGAGGPRAT